MMRLLSLVLALSAAALVSAQTCPNLVCLASGADCISASVLSYCPETQYKAFTPASGTTTATCTCTEISAAPSLGANCTGAVSNECGPDLTRQCGRNFTSGVLQCYGTRLIGDKCSSSYDCSPPRSCVSGICSANLATGAACRDSSSNPLGQCAQTDYCPTAASSICTARPGTGAACNGAAVPCQPNLVCEPGKLVCEARQYGYIASGLPANATYECGSYVWNATSRLCLDYVSQNTLFQNAYSGQSCSTSAFDCGALGTCACTRQSSNNTARCVLRSDVIQPSIFSQLNVQRAGFDYASCESYALAENLAHLGDTNLCAVNNGYASQFKAQFCLNFWNFYYTVPQNLECKTIYTVENLCGFSSSSAGARVSSSSSSSSTGTSTGTSPSSTANAASPTSAVAAAATTSAAVAAVAALLLAA